jgi:hypothetical protein
MLLLIVRLRLVDNKYRKRQGDSRQANKASQQANRASHRPTKLANKPTGQQS